MSAISTASAREILLLSDRRSKAIDKAEATNEAGLRLLLQVTDDILSRIGARITQGVSGQTDRWTCNASLRRCALPMRHAPISIGSPPCSTGSRRPQVADALPGLRQQLAVATDSLSQSVAMLASDAAPRVGDLRDAARSLAALGTADDGLLAIQTKLLPERQAVASQQAALQAIGVDLREQVSKLNESAEREASSTAALWAQAIDASRLWLIMIAATSLILAGLIVWLFVLRYVLPRLALATDVGVARGGAGDGVPLRVGRTR